MIPTLSGRQGPRLCLEQAVWGSLTVCAESLGLGWTWVGRQSELGQRSTWATPFSSAREHPVRQHHGPFGEDH